MFINNSLIVLLVYVITSVVFYGFSSYYFSIHSALLRKILYLLFFLGLSVGIISGNIDYKDWSFLLQLTAFIVLVDLSVYQTPNILKFGKAEFQHADKIIDNVRKNEKRIQFMNKKANLFTRIIQEGENDLTSSVIGSVSTKELYQQALTQYLEKYTKPFDFSLRLFFLSDDLANDIDTKQSIKNGLEDIEIMYNVVFNERIKRKITKALFEAKVFSFEDERYAIVPIYGAKYNFLVVLSANQEGIIEIDTTNIINMVTLFDWIV